MNAARETKWEETHSLGCFFFQIEWSGKVKWMDCTNVPSLSHLPVTMAPCNGPSQLTPSRGRLNFSSTSSICDRLWTIGCDVSDAGPAPALSLKRPCRLLLPPWEYKPRLACWRTRGKRNRDVHHSQGQAGPASTSCSASGPHMQKSVELWACELHKCLRLGPCSFEMLCYAAVAN